MTTDLIVNVTISKRDRVTFDDVETGRQTGTVLGLCAMPDGRESAVIEVDHSMPGMVWNVPLADLRRLDDGSEKAAPAWTLQCKLGGMWLAVAPAMPFPQAWASLSAMQKNAARLDIEPIERRLVIAFDQGPACTI